MLPGLALQEIWEITGAAERALFAVSALVAVVGLAGMLVAMLTGLNERRREMAILRSVGARPVHVFALILGEAILLTAAGIALGVATLYIGLIAGQSWLEARLGLFIAAGWPGAREIGLMAMVAIAGAAIGVVPGMENLSMFSRRRADIEALNGSIGMKPRIGNAWLLLAAIFSSATTWRTTSGR